MDSSRISLRPFRLSDVDDVMIWGSDDRVTSQTRWETLTSKEDALNFIKNVCIPYPWRVSICIDDRSIGFLWVLNPGRRIVLDGYVNNIDEEAALADIGYAIAFEYWGQGIATKALKLAVPQVFNHFPDLVKLQAFALLDNKASHRVLEKAGFLYQGRWTTPMKVKRITVVNLPQEIIVEILLRLPVRSVIKFGCASKSWYAFVNGPDFRKRHLSLAKQQINLKNVIIRSCPLTFSPLSVVLSDNPCIEDMVTLHYYYPMCFHGFCDGLICSSISGDWRDGRVSVLNPSTGESKILPASPFEVPAKSYSLDVTFGIGYNSVCDDYNVLRMATYHVLGPLECQNCGTEMKLYSLKTNSWRKIQDLPRRTFYTGTVCCFLHGAFHWFAYQTFSQDGPCVVVSLNISEEKYGEIPIPRLNYSCYGLRNRFNLVVLRGMLCISCNYSSGSFHLWAMKEYGVEDSWTNLFTIWFDPSEPYVSFEARDLFENGEILLEASLANGERKLVICQGERFGFRTLIANSINVVSYGYVYEQSLVSLSGRN